MMLKEQYSEKFLYEKLEEYTSTYDDSIDSFTKAGMSYYLCDGLYSDRLACEVVQMYHEYNLAKEKLNIYYIFRDFLKQVYSNLEKRKILEVGAGAVPQLAREITKESKEEVIAIDKKITSRNNPSNLITVKSEFCDDTDINDRNLIIGLHPCDATINIIKNAAKNNIDFAIAVCDCTYSDPYLNWYKFLDPNYEWNKFLSDVKDITKQSDLGEVNVIDTKFSPFIYTSKK